MAKATMTKEAPETDIADFGTTPEFNAKASKKAKKAAKKATAKLEGKGKGGLIVKISAVLVVGLIIAAFWFNILGVKDRYLMPILQRIPVVNNLLPTVEEDTDPYAELTKEELVANINEMQSQIDEKDEQIKSLSDKNGLFASQITDLQHFRDQQAQFKIDKEEFDRMIASGLPIDFARFFEQISPENAARLYSEAIQQEAFNKELSEYVGMIQNMEDRAAALMLSQLIRSDAKLVANVLKSMDAKKSGAILSEMSAQDAAQITKRMYPEEPPAQQPLTYTYTPLPTDPATEAPADATTDVVDETLE